MEVENILQKQYNELNAREQKELKESFMQTMQHSTNHRFYLLLREPAKLTALELAFFSEQLAIEPDQILDSILNKTL